MPSDIDGLDKNRLGFSSDCLFSKNATTFSILRFIRTTLAALIIMVLVAPVIFASQTNDTVDLQILAFNDLHGQLEPPSGKLILYYNSTGKPVKAEVGGVAYLAAYIKQLKAENPDTIVVSAGDNIGAGPLESALFHDQPTIAAMNLMGVEYSAVGNHELDKGLAELERIQNGSCHPLDGCYNNETYPGARFSYLAANMVNATTGTAIFPPYKVCSVQGIPVGIIGVALKDTPTIVSASHVKGLKFLDEADTINLYVQELKTKGIRTIIVLIHDGGYQTGLFNDSISLKSSIIDIINRTDDGVDAFITGHTHQAYNSLINGRIVTQAGSNGKILTDIDLIISKQTGDVISSRAKNVAIAHDLPEDPAVAGQVHKYKNLSAPLANEVIGSITTNITDSSSASGESKLGDIIADSQLNDTAESNGAVVAFTNSGGIRADLLYSRISGNESPGQVTYGEAFNVQPFSNCLITMNLTGAQVGSLLEQQFDNPSSGDLRILQVSMGFSYSWNKSAPKGSKVEVDSIKINGKAIDLDSEYSVTVNGFLADGGDNFTVFKDGTDRRGGPTDLEAFVDYIESHSPLSPGNERRISVESIH